MRTLLLVCASVILLVMIVGQCSKSTNPQQTASDPTTPAPATSTGATNPSESSLPAEPKSDWSITTQTDEIRGKLMHFAEVTSENEVYFDPPYDGGSRLTMVVRRHPKYGDDVYFQISDGQFVCHLDDCMGTINFGSGPETLTLGVPDDYDSKTLFARFGPAIIRKLKGADKVIVELPFYQEGRQQFRFKTHGLVWPPKQAVTK